MIKSRRGGIDASRCNQGKNDENHAFRAMVELIGPEEIVRRATLCIG
jgi:hypothetical protein